MMESALTLIAMALLLLLKGFFSGSEIALVNADKLKLRHKAKKGKVGAQLVVKLIQTPEKMLGTTLVGTNIATVTLTTLGTVMMIRTFGERGDLLAFVLFTPLLLIFGEIVPKSVYQQKADTLAPIIIYPLRFFSLLFFPVIYVFSRLARLAVRVLARTPAGENVFVIRDQMRVLLDTAEQATSTDGFDRARIKRAIRFSDISVSEAMIPLSETVVINSDRSLPHAVNLVRQWGYNRLPVYSKDVSEIIGVVVLTAWDLLDPDLKQRKLSDYIRPAHYVAASQPIDQLTPLLQAREDHMAIVVDEFGSAIGLITIEDILEEVVGEIEDVDFRIHSRRPRGFAMLEEDVYLMDGRLPISELNEVLGLQLPAKEFYTVGGLLITRLQHIPAKDESVVEAGYRFTVTDADERVVRSVRVEPCRSTQATSNG